MLGFLAIYNILKTFLKNRWTAFLMTKSIIILYIIILPFFITRIMDISYLSMWPPESKIDPLYQRTFPILLDTLKAALLFDVLINLFSFRIGISWHVSSRCHVFGLNVANFLWNISSSSNIVLMPPSFIWMILIFELAYLGFILGQLAQSTKRPVVPNWLKSIPWLVFRIGCFGIAITSGKLGGNTFSLFIWFPTWLIQCVLWVKG